jgi:hypothetical protein
LRYLDDLPLAVPGAGKAPWKLQVHRKSISRPMDATFRTDFSPCGNGKGHQRVRNRPMIDHLRRQVIFDWFATLCGCSPHRTTRCYKEGAQIIF